MANDDQDLELDVGDDAEEGGGGKSKKIIIIAAAAVLLIGAGIAAFLLLSGDSEPADENATEEVKEEPKEPAQYVGVPEAITSNIPGTKRNRTVQIKMSFMVRGDDAVDRVKAHMPQLKNDVLMLVSQQTADEVQKPEGRIMLQEKSLEVVQKTLTDLTGEPTVEKVLFISFVMQ